MEKWLIFIPVVKNQHVLSEAVDQILWKRDIHLIILLNGADKEVCDTVYEKYAIYPQVTVWNQDVNSFVTNAWNSAINHFLNSPEYDRLFIMNSDLTLQCDWDLILRMIWEEYPNIILTPKVIDDKTKMYEHIQVNITKLSYSNNPAGIFIALNKKMAELVYPIPSEIRIWFNDSYLYQLLEASGYEIMIPDNLLAFHHVSTTIHRVEGALEIIEQDKIAWRDIVEPMLQEKIKQIK